MEERILGATGLTVSRIGLGLAAVGRPAYINVGRDEDLADDRTIEAMRHRTHRLLDAATAAGIRYVDAARSYGLAESFLGSWLAGRPPDALGPVIGSKWGYTYVGGWRMDAAVNEVKDLSLTAFRRQLDESLAILGERLRLYQVHSATLESGVLEHQPLLAELAALRERGIANGLSVSGPRQAEVIRRALEIRIDGRPVFSSVQATWNLLEPSAGPALAEAHDAGWGVIVKEAVANGRLARPESAPPDVAAAVARHSVTHDAIAIAAVLAQPWADVVLSGAVADGQLVTNVASLEVELNSAELASLLSAAEPADAYWAERGARAWT